MINLRYFINLMVFTLLISSDLFCQTDPSTKTELFDQKFKITKNSLVHNDTATFKMSKNAPIRITRTNGDSIFVKLSIFADAAAKPNQLLNKVEKNNENFYFLISEGTDKLNFRDFDVSPLVIPLKIRPALDNNPLQFLGDIALGPYLGYQVGTNSYELSNQVTQTAFTICVFGSPTMINLNPSNQTVDSQTSSSVLGISAGSGLLFDLNNLQFGLVGGWDWISGTLSQTWNYQGKPWASFSFAYNLTNQ